MSHHYEPDIGNIKDSELDEILETEVGYIVSSLIENMSIRTSAQSTIEQGALAPKKVEGRDVDMVGRLRSPGGVKDIDGFYLLLQQAIEDKLDRQHIAEADRPIFTEDFNPDEIRAETITVCLKGRKPMSTGQGKHGSGGSQEWKARLRGIYDDPTKPNKKLYIFGRRYDNRVRIECYARTNKVANVRALWLEALMDEYMWFFRYEGCGQIRYDGRDEDGHKVIGSDNKLICRPLNYYIMTEKLFEISEYVMRSLIIKARLAEGITPS